MIKKNQIIVKEGEPITQRQISILTELGLIGDSVSKDYMLTYIIIEVICTPPMVNIPTPSMTTRALFR